VAAEPVEVQASEPVEPVAEAAVVHDAPAMEPTAQAAAPVAEAAAADGESAD
jgi:hypothetical protein